MVEEGADVVSPAEAMVAFENRRRAVLEVLQSPEWNRFDGCALTEYWLEELINDFDPAVQRALRAGGKTASVTQFADSFLHNPDEADFANQYLRLFGARATFTNSSDSVEATAENLSSIVTHPSIRHFTTSFLLDYLDELPIGSMVIHDQTGDIRYLVLETKIEGVRLIMDGSAVTSPGHSFRVLRPSLLVEIGNAPIPIVPVPETPPPERKTWREVHGREPSKPGGQFSLADRVIHQGLRGNTLARDEQGIEAWQAATAWRPSAKTGEEILVTPAKLKENPVLASSESQLARVKATLQIAVAHLRDKDEREKHPVSPQSAHALSIMVDVLEMTAEEIIRDSEALADLWEYLEEMARGQPGTYAPSQLLPPAPEGHPIAELAGLIEDTWEFPQRSFAQPPYMYERVNWRKRPGMDPGSN